MPSPIMEGHKFYQEQFAFTKAMMAVTNPLFIFHALQYSFWEDLLHDFNHGLNRLLSSCASVFLKIPIRSQVEVCISPVVSG